jgi:hypothetical protein
MKTSALINEKIHKEIENEKNGQINYKSKNGNYCKENEMVLLFTVEKIDKIKDNYIKFIYLFLLFYLFFNLKRVSCLSDEYIGIDVGFLFN